MNVCEFCGTAPTCCVCGRDDEASLVETVVDISPPVPVAA